MGAHLVDHPVWGLDLGWPTSIETISTPFNGLSYPVATTTHYEFPARGTRPAVKMTWYDGGFMPPRPAEMGEMKLNPNGGVLYIGTKGKMLQESTGTRPRLLPVELHNSAGAPPEKMPRVPNQAHEMNWVNAIRGTDTISCPFSYAAYLTEIMLLGVAALGRARGCSTTAPRCGSRMTSRPTISSGASIGRDSGCRDEPKDRCQKALVGRGTAGSRTF